MKDWVTFIHFIVLGLSLAAPIGPMNIEVMRRGLTGGFLASWCVGLGGLTGDVLLLLGIYFGLGDVMRISGVQIGMYVIGIVLLTILGWQSFHHAFQTKDRQDIVFKEISPKSAYMTGFMISIANPISLIFWFGVFGTSLHVLTASHSVVFSVLCSFAILLGLFLWNLNLVCTIHFSKRLMSVKVMRTIMILAGLCLLGFACHFSYRLYNLIL
ncbi:Threonine/homoserine/homoserine lactone efflux protein [Fictibacillus solisalsi]|uniref:Threonine/homoserine/homoserine lactone efflux protein n=2 Tax=Fictibacillus solisalsi TaxID=459525 RepID=A0A1G9TM84_9BACL|nr:Threonine/homoserine/homoserine lactone efflux protein [Fictibacillus solisalsi]